jgi:type II pantothenate kinase
MSIPSGTVGIDAGATLWKLVYQAERLHMAVVPAGDFESLGRQVGAWGPSRVCLTGGGAVRVEAALDAAQMRQVPEFEAWARGAPMLAKRAGVDLPERYLLVSLGTGTSVLAVDHGDARRVAGTALGGGTLVGLGRLLLGIDAFDELAALAQRGDRRRVDLLVGDIYPEGGISLHPDLNASSFAKLESREPADLAHAMMGLVGENVGIICTVTAQAAGIRTVVFGGKTLSGNPALEEILRLVTVALNHEALFLVDGAFCGAIGAAMHAEP